MIALKKLFRRKENGDIALISVFASILILTIFALIVDFGLIYYQSAKLQNAVDSATVSVAHNLMADDTAIKTTVEKYMKENNIFDISLSSNLGYKEEDIEKFKEDADVKEIQGVFLYDVLTLYDKKDVTLRLFSSDKESDINKSKILDGRNIEKDNECLICSRLKDMYGYNIGDKIKVYRTDDTNLDDYIKYTEYEIVGVAQNPAYISKFYGNTTLLTGELNSYIIVDKQVFNMKDYTTVYIKLDIDENINKFSDEYKKELEDKLDKIKSIDKEIAQNKFDKLYKEKEKEVLDYASQIEKTEQYIEKLGCSSDTDSFLLNGKFVFMSFNAQRFDADAANPYAPCAFTWPSTFPQAESELHDELQRLMTLLGMRTSVFNIETRVSTDGKPYIMECTPRGGGNRLCEMLHYATGKDLITAQVRAAVGDAVDVETITPDAEMYHGHWAEIILHAKKSGVYEGIEIANNLPAEVVEKDMWVRKGDKVEAFNGANNAIGTLVLRFADKEEMEYAVTHQHEWLRIDVR